MKINSIEPKFTNKFYKTKATMPIQRQNKHVENDVFCKNKSISFKSSDITPFCEFADHYVEDEEIDKIYEEHKKRRNGDTIIGDKEGTRVLSAPSVPYFYKKLIYILSGGRTDEILSKDYRYYMDIENASKIDKNLSEEEIKKIVYDKLTQYVDCVDYGNGAKDKHFTEKNIKKDINDAYEIGKRNYAKHLATITDPDELIKIKLASPEVPELTELTIEEGAKQLLAEGRFNEFKERYSKLPEIYNKALNAFGINDDGEYEEIKFEFPEAGGIDFEAENEKINSLAAAMRNDAIEKAENDIKASKGTGVKRGAKAVFTLGISEIIRHVDLNHEKRENLKNANREILEKRKSLDKKINEETMGKKAKLDGIEKSITAINELEKKKEDAKEILTSGLINKIGDLYKGIPVSRMPNCVMFIGNNPFIAKELALWVNEVTDTDFILIPSDKDNEKMQEDMYDELVRAEENYQNTGKRTIMYIEGMDKLLRPETNSPSNIASMKEIMQCCNEDYHTTILFMGESPENYEEAIDTRGRIGLKVPIPISKEESNIKKITEEGNN